MRVTQLVLSLFPWLSAFFDLPLGPGTDNAEEFLLTPITCLASSTTFYDLVNCFDAFTVPHDTYTNATYTSAQPNGNETAAWGTVVDSLLNVDGNCGSALLPGTLNGTYTVTLFTETGGKSYCVLSESQATSGHYNRGWGLVAVPATRAAVSRYIHISAPHPVYDPGSPQRAAAVFTRTGAKSLVISGRHRLALSTVNSCQGSDYKKTDAAHDTQELFFAANKATRTWQTSNGGCPTASCAYIQIHRQTSCPDDHIYMSSGLGTTNFSTNWYNTHVFPIHRIKSELHTQFPNFTIHWPPDNFNNITNCNTLTATDNIFGRLINNVAEANVCTTSSSTSNATGQFVHIEQVDDVLLTANDEKYAKAVNLAMSTTCKTGMTMDSTTLLCV